MVEPIYDKFIILLKFRIFLNKILHLVIEDMSLLAHPVEESIF